MTRPSAPDSSLVAALRAAFSPGTAAVAALAIASSILIVTREEPRRAPLEMWVFARPHRDLYLPNVRRWNETRDVDVDLHLLSLPALERRMIAGFLSDVPVADLIEADVRVASRAFNGPVADIGFLDLTDRLEEEGIRDEINEPSFSPWTTRGRIFGLPHDVHPVMLAYRADIVEAAGIDVSEIETWDDFIRILSPLMADRDGDGRADRYLLNLWETQIDTIEALMLQGGGRYFDDDERPVIASGRNARLLSRLATWIAGPHRIAVDAQEFMASGNRLKIEGICLAALMPDWLGGVWKNDMPQLSGKVKLMPVPAWERGGRRTTVRGGTMLGIARSTKHPAEAWELAKRLYLSQDLAEQLYRTNGIISPIKRFWSLPIYDEPDPYFCGQAPGRMYVGLAPDVPRRTSSPFNQVAKERVRDALIAVKRHGERTGKWSLADLEPVAARALAVAQEAIATRMRRNVFLGDER